MECPNCGAVLAKAEDAVLLAMLHVVATWLIAPDFSYRTIAAMRVDVDATIARAEGKEAP